MTRTLGHESRALYNEGYSTGGTFGANEGKRVL